MCCRVPGERDLPAFIICTLDLLTVKLMDSGTDDLHLRLVYSMAIIRFVSVSVLGFFVCLRFC